MERHVTSLAMDRRLSGLIFLHLVTILQYVVDFFHFIKTLKSWMFVIVP